MQMIKVTFTGRPTGFPDDGYMRCGHRWTLAAQLIAEDMFTDDQWKQLEADPFLKLTNGGEEADDLDVDDEPDDVEIAKAIAQAIQSLDADDFTDKGAAKVGPVREALGEDFVGAITAKQVSLAQAELIAGGWAAPQKEAG